MSPIKKKKEGVCLFRLVKFKFYLDIFTFKWLNSISWSNANITCICLFHALQKIVWKLHAQRRLRNDLDKMQEGGLREFIERMLSTTKGWVMSINNL